MPRILLKVFEALLRKVIYGFIQRLEDSSNVIIQTLTESWTICFVDWQCWFSKLYKYVFVLHFSYDVLLVASLRLHITISVLIVEVINYH